MTALLMRGVIAEQPGTFVLHPILFALGIFVTM